MVNERKSGIDNSWSVPRMWEGQTAYIIGGGPSLNDVDLSLIRDKNVLGINNAYKLGSWVDLIYFMDNPWFDQHKKALLEYPNPKVSTLKNIRDVDHPNIKYLKGEYSAKALKDPTKLCVKGHSGFAAIHLARLLGAKEIVLLGYDMKSRDGNHNWHNDHKRKIQEKLYEKKFIPTLKELDKPMQEEGIKILNASPDSVIDFWEKIDLEDHVRKT